MGSETPIRNQFGTIVGLQPKGEIDPVQEVLDASMQAVGAIPEVQPSATAPAKRPLPPLPSLRIEVIAVVAIIVVIGLTFLSRRNSPAPDIIPTSTAAPTATPSPSATPTNINPRSVTLSAITLYGDYDEATHIGNAPDGAVCLFDGHSPDEAWIFLNCPVPIGYVWAKLSDLKLSEVQQKAVRTVQVVARVVPPTPQPVRLPANAFTPPPSLPFCADRYSQWGNTHQCATDQLSAERLAETEITKINATAEAIHQSATK